MAFTVGKYGIGSLKQLGFLVMLFYGAVALFVLVVLGTVMRLCGFSVLSSIRYLRAELLVVLGTASSDSAAAGDEELRSSWASRSRWWAW